MPPERTTRRIPQRELRVLEAWQDPVNRNEGRITKPNVRQASSLTATWIKTVLTESRPERLRLLVCWPDTTCDTVVSHRCEAVSLTYFNDRIAAPTRTLIQLILSPSAKSVHHGESRANYFLASNS